MSLNLVERGKGWVVMKPSLFYERWVRWNSPYINHFTSPDSIIPNPYNSQSWDRYAYVNNNPVNATDPTGHQCVGEPGECLEDDGTTGPGFPGTGGTVSNPGAGDCSGAGCQAEDDNNPSSNDVCDQILGCEDPDAGVFCDQYSCWYDADTDISGTYEDPAVYISLLAGGWASGLFSASFWGTATACIGNVVCTFFTGMAGGAGTANAGNGSSAWQFPSSGPITQNGITFSKHALERMLPVGLGGRGVPPSVVENVVTIGQRTPTLAQNVVEIVSNNVTVIFNTVTNTVITVIKTGH